MTTKVKFILKSIIGCLLIAQLTGFSIQGSTIIDAFPQFINYFSVMLILWLIIPEQLLPPKWLLGGLLGSIIFALGLPLLIFFITHNNLYTVAEIPYLVFLEKTVFGFLGATPLWLILRKKTPKAYMFPIASGIGYGLTFLPSLIFEVTHLRERVYNVDGILLTSLLYYFTGKFLTYSGYALLGLLLGICIYDLILQERIEKV